MTPGLRVWLASSSVVWACAAPRAEPAVVEAPVAPPPDPARAPAPVAAPPVTPPHPPRPAFTVLYDLTWSRPSGVEIWGAGDASPRVGERFAVLDLEGFVAEVQFDRVEPAELRRGRPPWEPGWIATASWTEGPVRDPGPHAVLVGPFEHRPARWGRVLWPEEQTGFFLATEGTWHDLLRVDVDGDDRDDIGLQVFACSERPPQHASSPTRLVLGNARDRFVVNDPGFCPEEAGVDGGLP